MRKCNVCVCVCEKELLAAGGWVGGRKIGVRAVKERLNVTLKCSVFLLMTGITAN